MWPRSTRSARAPRAVATTHWRTVGGPFALRVILAQGAAIDQRRLQLDLAVGVVAAVEAHQDALAVHLGDDAHRPAPHGFQVHQRVLGIADAPIPALLPFPTHHPSPSLPR